MPGNLLAISFHMGQGVGETAFLEPKIVSKMKMLLQVSLRKNEKKKKRWKKKKTRKRCRSEGEPNRCEYGEINSVVDTAIKQNWRKTSLVVQGLRLGTFTVIDIGSIPDRRTKISNTAWHGQKINSNKKKKKRK